MSARSHNRKENLMADFVSDYDDLAAKGFVPSRVETKVIAAPVEAAVEPVNVAEVA
jgi:hypothetical protein